MLNILNHEHRRLRSDPRRGTRDVQSGFASGKPRGSLALAGFVALLGGFVATAGAGSGNTMVAAMGGGIAISGLMYWGFTLTHRRRVGKVAGTAHVVTATAPPSGATHGRCEMHLVVQGPDLTATTVRHRDSAVPAAKWPTPGASLPVTVNPRDPRDLHIQWSRVQPHGTVNRPTSLRVEQLSKAPAGAPDQQELATLADAAQTTGNGARGQPSPMDSADTPVSRDGAAAPTTDLLDSGTSVPADFAVYHTDEPIDLSFLDPMAPPPVDLDPLLAEYGSPIREVGVTLIVSDIKQSLEFYRDMLGFFEIESGPEMVLLEARTGRLVLRQRDDTHALPPRLMHLTLEVNDIDAAHQNLARRGVEFLDEPRTVLRGELLELWAVSFHDPDGHGVALTCWRPRAEERPSP